MDAIATPVLDTGAFWPSDRANSWHGSAEDEGDYGVPHGITSWESRSMGFQDSGLTGSDETGYGYNSYGNGNQDEWALGPSDLDADSKLGLPHCGEKRRSDSLSNDGYDRPETPNSPLLQGSSSKQRASGTGSLFFKTKLCVKFKAGTCPYNSNCNFAHGMDELRKPPPGWEDMVGALDGGGGTSAVPSSSDSLRFRRTRRCKKYYSEEGCPYGDRCNFLHDDQAKNRESNAISLGPTMGSSSGGGGGNATGERPSNWKTRMCNKWEMTGHCPFGQKCNFAHGHAELQMYAGGAPADGETKALSGGGLPSDSKQTARTAPKSQAEVGSSIVLNIDGLNSNISIRQRSTYTPASKSQKQMKVMANWRGPADEISTIYGDWIGEED